MAEQRETLQERRQRHLDTHEAYDDLLFQGDSLDQLNGYFLMRSADERLPYAFIKSDPFFLEGLVESWSIKELEMPLRSESKELTTRQHLFR